MDTIRSSKAVNGISLLLFCCSFVLPRLVSFVGRFWTGEVRGNGEANGVVEEIGGLLERLVDDSGEREGGLRVRLCDEAIWLSSYTVIQI